MAKKRDDQRNRICLDCAKMQHDKFDYYRGRCAEDGHRIDQVNNHSWCRNFCLPDWRKPHIENRDGYESVSVGDTMLDGAAMPLSVPLGYPAKD